MTGESRNWQQIFDWAAGFLAVALLLHGADHLRRGMNVIPPAVMIGGTLQLILAAVTIALVFRRNRWAPLAAVGIGFAGAVGFTAAHLIPKWGFFSDSFINAPPWARVTAFSWVTAILEIAANLIFGAIGLMILKEGAPYRVQSEGCRAGAAGWPSRSGGAQRSGQPDGNHWPTMGSATGCDQADRRGRSGALASTRRILGFGGDNDAQPHN